MEALPWFVVCLFLSLRLCLSVFVLLQLVPKERIVFYLNLNFKAGIKDDLEL